MTCNPTPPIGSSIKGNRTPPPPSSFLNFALKGKPHLGRNLYRKTTTKYTLSPARGGIFCQWSALLLYSFTMIEAHAGQRKQRAAIARLDSAKLYCKAMVELSEGHLPLASQDFEKASQLYNKAGDYLGMASLYANTARVAVQLKQYKIAKEEYSSAEKIYSGIGLKLQERQCTDALASLPAK